MRQSRRAAWWIPPFLGSAPEELDDSHLELLGAVALALFCEQYAIGLLVPALKFIAKDLALAPQSLGNYLGAVQLGALPAFLLVPWTDRIGRRRVFLFSLGATVATTFTSAFSQTPTQFIALQALTRTFFVLGSAAALVIVTEEFPAAHRGWGIGMLAALGAVGHGLSALLFAQIGWLPFGWRALFALALLSLLLLPFLGRRVHETERFTRHRAESEGPVAWTGRYFQWLDPLIGLALTHPARAALVALTGLLGGIGMIAAFQFTGYFTQTVHGWTPGQYALMVIVGGGLGIGGNIVAGRLGDDVGRRRVGFALLGLFPPSVALFYLGPTVLLPAAWVAFVFCSTGGHMILRALSVELFPTAHRGTASGMFVVVGTVGSASGLFLTDAAARITGDLATAIVATSSVVLGSAGILLFLPETHRRELEEISRS